MIDLHTHVLPGVDDGARTLDDAVEMLAAAEREGVTAVAATPHVRHDYPTSADAMERGVLDLRAELAARGIAVDVLTGGEIDREQLARLTPDELRRFALGGNPGYLLVETPYVGWPLAFPAELTALLDAGVVPVLAHPERNEAVQSQPELLAPLVQAGLLVQLTVSSAVGRSGPPARRAASDLLERELAHLAASDMHSKELARDGLAALATALGSAELAEWLGEAVPHSIVAGTPLPPRRRPRRRLLRRR